MRIVDRVNVVIYFFRQSGPRNRQDGALLPGLQFPVVCFGRLISPHLILHVGQAFTKPIPRKWANCSVQLTSLDATALTS